MSNSPQHQFSKSLGVRVATDSSRHEVHSEITRNRLHLVITNNINNMVKG